MTEVKSAALSRNVTSRCPLSIIVPNEGQSDTANFDELGEKEMASTPAALKTVSYAVGFRLSIFTISIDTTMSIR